MNDIMELNNVEDVSRLTVNCTSPSILEDITLNRSENDTRGAIGLTMKEYDDQIKKLTADNFQLKLKIYFLDEKITKLRSIQDKDLIHENVELQVENKEMKEELERKSKLLLDSLDAIEHLQQEHQKEIADLLKKHEEERRELEVRCGALETRIRLLENSPIPSLVPEECSLASCAEQIQNLQLKLQESESHMEKMKCTEESLRKKLSKMEEELKEVEVVDDQVIQLTQEIETYKCELEKATSALDKIKNTKSSDVNCELERKLAETEKLLAERESELSRSCVAIKNFVHKAHDHRAEKEQLLSQIEEERKLVIELKEQIKTAEEKRSVLVNALKCQNCSDEPLNLESCAQDVVKIQELEREVIALQQKQKDGGASQLEEKNNEIERLKSDLSKRTHNLQELVNKELWQKNKQIEKLEKRLMDEEVHKLKQQLSDAAVEKSALQKEIVRLQEKETPLREACAVLTERLEELAGFLDSLLTDRQLLGMCGEQHEAIKQAVDRSRELSRRLTLSFDEPWQFSELSRFADQSSVISKLREQLSVLSNQVRQRDIELSIYQGDETSLINEREESEPLPFTPLENDQKWLHLEVPEDIDGKRRENTSIRRKSEKSYLKMATGCKGELDASESEAWSEPDRSVSLARMGHLDSTSLTPLRLSKCTADSSGSSEDTLNENKSSGKRNRCLDAENRRLLSKLKSLEEHNKTLKLQLTLMENKHAILSKLGGESAPQLLREMQQSLSELEETRECCIRLREELATARGDLSIAKEELAEKEKYCEEQKEVIAKLEYKADEIILEYELRLVEAEQEKHEVEKRAVDVAESMTKAENLRMQLEKQVSEISSQMSESQARENKSKAQMREAERHLDSCERMILEKMESERKIKELHQFIECLQKSQVDLQKDITLWKHRYQKDCDEVTELKKQLAEAEKSKTMADGKVKEQGERIKWMEGKLRELDQAMDQCEQETQVRIAEEVQRRVEGRITELKKCWVPKIELEKAKRNLELLEGKLKTSESVKSSLEESLKEREEALSERINRLENEKREWVRQLNNIRIHNSELEVQLTRLTNEKLKLEEELFRIINEKSRLEEKQAELLRNHRQAEETIRNLEKQAEDESVSGSHQINMHDVLAARNLNSSPDLGIESDQGRFSSLENQPVFTRDTNMNQVELENLELKRQVGLLNQKLEETQADLAASNHHKRQMEKAICKQLHKTHHILKKARIKFEMQDSDASENNQ